MRMAWYGSVVYIYTPFVGSMLLVLIYLGKGDRYCSGTVAVHKPVELMCVSVALAVCICLSRSLKFQEL